MRNFTVSTRVQAESLQDVKKWVEHELNQDFEWDIDREEETLSSGDSYDVILQECDVNYKIANIKNLRSITEFTLITAKSVIESVESRRPRIIAKGVDKETALNAVDVMSEHARAEVIIPITPEMIEKAISGLQGVLVEHRKS